MSASLVLNSQVVMAGPTGDPSAGNLPDAKFNQVDVTGDTFTGDEIHIWKDGTVSTFNPVNFVIRSMNVMNDWTSTASTTVATLASSLIAVTGYANTNNGFGAFFYGLKPGVTGLFSYVTGVNSQAAVFFNDNSDNAVVIADKSNTIKAVGPSGAEFTILASGIFPKVTTKLSYKGGTMIDANSALSNLIPWGLQTSGKIRAVGEIISASGLRLEGLSYLSNESATGCEEYISGFWQSNKPCSTKIIDDEGIQFGKTDSGSSGYRPSVKIGFTGSTPTIETQGGYGLNLSMGMANSGFQFLSNTISTLDNGTLNLNGPGEVVNISGDLQVPANQHGGTSNPSKSGGWYNCPNDMYVVGIQTNASGNVTGVQCAEL